MKWTSLNELREKYLAFFESKGHLRLPSFSLIPNNDKSLLLINSGMAPMKKFFTGEEEPPRNRVTTCQKCIRTPDLERVGHTARHGTFFEMLGNFSFGGNIYPADYDTAIIQQEVILEADGTVTLGERTIIPCSLSSMEKRNNYQPTPYEAGTAAYDRVLQKLDGSWTGPNLPIQ